ncbi:MULTISPECIES: FMN-binding negative transcriptional regulator [Flavobacterium]|nr:FMN-binding negative transcriptional regulator [Flavobacterium sp. N1846]
MSKDFFSEKGFAIIDNVYTDEEVNTILELIEKSDSGKETYRKTQDVFAIRQALKEIPKLKDYVFNANIKEIIKSTGGDNCFVVKSIYFDKPETSNWFVAYHQDLTISIKDKVHSEGFTNWTKKQNQFAVQPPVEILENIFTIRIHLDTTTKENGAVKVIEKSHLLGIYRPELLDKTIEKETICEVEKGGIMLIKPLTLHASTRTTNHKRRRVLHIEFSNSKLPESLEWSEYSKIKITMYIPDLYKNENQPEIEQFLRDNGFAILINQTNGKLWGTHTPLVFEKTPEGKAILSGHISKENPQAENLKDREEILAIFNGPHSYISSSWYDHENVPTWNYVAVHVYGKITLLTPHETIESLKKLVNKYEKQQENPIKVENLSTKTMLQARGIVAFEIEITEIQAKRKLSQNRDDKNHQTIINHLENSKDFNSKIIASEMKKDRS